MRKLLVIPTFSEANHIIARENFRPLGDHVWASQSDAHLLITGAGIPNTIAGIMLYTSRFGAPDASLHAGIAGAYGKKFRPGSVVWVSADQFAEMGAEKPDGTLISMNALGFHHHEIHKMASNRLEASAQSSIFSDLPAVAGITVQLASGCEATIQRRISAYEADIESMETAAFFFTCKLMAFPVFEAIRAVSNYVEPRNRNAWEIETAIHHLNKSVSKWLHAVHR